VNLNDKNDLVELGFSLKPHGIKGGFTFALDNLEDSVLKKGSKVYLFPKNASSSLRDCQEFSIKSIAFGNKVIAYFEEVNDRNTVEAMLPFVIKYPRSLFPEIGDDEYYVGDVIGVKVYDHTSGEHLGEIVDHSDNGMQIIYTIKTQGRTFDLPFVEALFPVVDIEGDRVEIVSPRIIE
jgi:16S rRNA processing protein RimM